MEMAPDRPVAILVALDVEAEALVRQLARSTISSPHLSVWEGAVEGRRVVLVITGVGKVSAAAAAQFTCDAFDPECLLVVGLAGASLSDGQPGQLVVASGALQHDMDARPFTDARGVIPSLGKTVFAADPSFPQGCATPLIALSTIRGLFVRASSSRETRSSRHARSEMAS
jgi:adenosylhomocysteine nucleosidase